MTDAYLAIADIANDTYMQERMFAAATQQNHLGTVTLLPEPLSWVMVNRYVWAASPSWGEKWEYAKETHVDQEEYHPGRDSAVITDEDILATVQALGIPDTPTL